MKPNDIIKLFYDHFIQQSAIQYCVPQVKILAESLTDLRKIIDLTLHYATVSYFQS